MKAAVLDCYRMSGLTGSNRNPTEPVPSVALQTCVQGRRGFSAGALPSQKDGHRVFPSLAFLERWLVGKYNQQCGLTVLQKSSL